MGLSLNRFADNVSQALSRKPFKPGVSFTQDPVPATTADRLANIPAFRPGHGAPDPVPAVSADATNNKAFKTPITLNEDGSYSWMEVSPVPARSAE